MQEQILHARSSCTHQRIVHAAIQFYRAIGYRKTTVADIARETAMSPANVYRFFASRRALEEAVVAELFEEVFAAAAQAARSSGSALQRLAATLRTISQLHEHRLARDSQLHELMAAAVRENWPVALYYADRIGDLVRPIIAAGQASGEVRLASPVSLTCCLLEAMDGHLNPSRINPGTVRLAFDEMMDFCAGALHHVPRGRSIDLIADQSCSVRIASGVCG